MNPDDLATLIMQHQWTAAAALAIGLIVRLLKSDGPVPINIPAAYRPWLAMGLGVAAGVLDKVMHQGTAWKPAILGGLVSAFLAISGHQLLIESARGGRELGEDKESFAKRSIPPPPAPDAAKTDPDKLA